MDRILRGVFRLVLTMVTITRTASLSAQSMLALEPARLNLPIYPAAAGYQVEEAFPGLPPLYAAGICVPPGETNQMVFLGKAGLLTVITNLAVPTLSVMLDLSAKTTTETECGLLGVAFHPAWRQNGQVFVYYSTTTDWAGQTGLHQRLSRFLLDPGNPSRLLPESELPLITQRDPDVSHNAGDLEFGPDGYLYVSVGDGGGAFDTYHNSQVLDGGFFSGILRLDVDRRPGSLEPKPHPAVNPGTYRVPADNPYVGRTNLLGVPVNPDKLRTEYWAIGLRNPFRMAFNPSTGELFANDVGQNRREEINRILPGRNYGWVFYEGSLAWPFTVPISPEFEFPLLQYEHEGGRVAITGAAWNSGTTYPGLQGAYFFADYGGPIGALKTNSNGGIAVQWLARNPAINDLGINPATGELVMATGLDGKLWKLVYRETPGPALPERLSATGIFTDLASLQVSRGVIPYEINQPFWSDHAVKRRWFALMDTNRAFQFDHNSPWDAPEGAVWIKHFELETNPGKEPARRLETRIVVRNTNGIWAATYRWRLDQSEADLVPADGADEDIPLFAGDANRPLRFQRWRYPSRSECLACHNSSAGYALGFNTAQLNRQVDHSGQTREQLALLASAGYLAGLPERVEPLPKLAALDDERWPTGYRVRSYLAANCSYCHRPDGPTRATWDGRLTTPLSEARIAGVEALNNLSDIYGQLSTQIAFPGIPEQSAIYRRVAELEPYHMPPIGTSEINTNAVGLLKDWIVNDLPAWQTFARWTTNHFPSPQISGLSGADDDPDSDGLSNEAEWLLQEDPLNPTRLWRFEATPEGDALRLRFQRKANLLCLVEWSDRLDAEARWEPVMAPENQFVIRPDDAQVDFQIPLSASQPRFFRVKITKL